MSNFTTHQLNMQMDAEQERREDLIAEQERRDEFHATDEAVRQERQRAFSFSNLYRKGYEILQQKGIDGDEYVVKLKDIKLAKTASGIEVLRTTYILQEPYLMKIDDQELELKNVHINTSAQCGFNTQYLQDFAITQLANLFDIFNLPEPTLEQMEYNVLIDLIKESGVLDKEFTVKITPKVLKNAKGSAVFYNAQPVFKR